MTSIERLKLQMGNNFECAIITSDVNRRYFTGMNSSAGTLIIFPDENYLIIDFRYIEKARATVKNCKIIKQERQYHQIYELLKKHNVKTVSVESHEMTLQSFSTLSTAIKNIKFDTSNLLSNAIYKCRTVKTEQEIEKIIAAQRIAEKALLETLNIIKVGVTEKEVALSLDYHMRKFGAENLSFTTIALSGANTSMPHGVPSDKKIAENEFVLMDFGAVVDGYHSDMTRTVCVGKPTEKMEEVYNIVLNAQNTAIKSARAGITGAGLDKIARDIITKAGYGDAFGHSLGHGVGMEIHEYPIAAPSQGSVFLKENNIVTVEPGIYLPGEFGVRIEDFVAIKENGCQNLTLADKKLLSL